MYQDLRRPRAVEVKIRSRRELEVFSMSDRVEQQERARLLLRKYSSERSPVSLLDPTFREWLWGFNALKAATKVQNELRYNADPDLSQ